MEQYIPKSVLVEKINNWIKDASRKYTMSKVQFSLDDRIKSLENLLSFIDTLEAKKVDLDNELDFAKDAYYYFTSDERSSMKKFAKHFFELGLKTQKGE